MDILEVPAGGPPWKEKHEGIPPAWKGKGSGGNAYVWLDSSLAIKRLKPEAGKEPLDRFAREAKLMSSIGRDDDLAVVPVVEVRMRYGALEIVMEAFDDNLDDIITEFSGQPEKVARALLPIIDTLIRLSHRSQPIHHRDIKPENLLYRRQNGEISFALGDFGCAYLAEDDRLTPIHRAIGAWAYRPPEYCIGRVQNVDEKGDVFSLGKVLWAMLNGERHVVFPGPVWFTDEFDLSRKFPGVPKIHHAMVVIARACEIRPEKRPTLEQLSNDLSALAASSTGGSAVNEEESIASMLRAEAMREVSYQQRRAFAKQFVLAIHGDFAQCIRELCSRVPQSAVFNAWLKNNVVGLDAHGLVSQVADLESDAPHVIVFYRKTLLNTRFLPATGDEPIRFTIKVEDQTGQVGRSELTIYGRESGSDVVLQCAGNQKIQGAYTAGILLQFLMESAQKLP
jgi:serine/threonine protein kinase